MKRFIIFICLLFTISCAYSQEHLEFRDIPINGSIKTFVKKLKKQGYKEYENKGTYRSLTGRFAVKDAFISVYGTEKTKTVWKVCVIFGLYETWQKLRTDYLELKELYISKYGNPTKEYDFIAPEYVGKEFEAIKNEKGAYGVFFEIPNGSIYMLIDAGGAIVVTYEDNVNGDLFNKEKLDGI